MKFFRKQKNKCDQCNKKFSSYDELVHHARDIHHHPIVKCSECGKEFFHEKDRLHHIRMEREEKMHERSHKQSHPEEFHTPQDRVAKHTAHFDDNL